VAPIIAAAASLIMLLAGLAAGHAQPPANVHRIGIVSPLAGSPEPPTVRAFRQMLRELGHVEGKSIIVEARYAEGQPDRFPGLFADLIGLNVEVLVVGSSMGALSAKKATSTIPIVFAGVGDPVEAGVVSNLSRPDGNITGATFGAGGSTITGKLVELLQEAIPGLTEAAVLYSSADAASPGYLRAVYAAARTLKVNIKQFDAGNDAALERAFAGIGATRAQGLVVTGSAYFGGNPAKLVRLSSAKRIPTIYFFSLFPEAGGLMSYGGSTEDSYRRAASQVDKILKGAKPADLPIDQATKYELVVNLKAAKALGIAIPRSLLGRADRVIE